MLENTDTTYYVKNHNSKHANKFLKVGIVYCAESFASVYDFTACEISIERTFTRIYEA